LNTLNIFSSLSVGDQISNPHKTASKMMVSNILIFKFSERIREDKNSKQNGTKYSPNLICSYINSFPSSDSNQIHQKWIPKREPKLYCCVYARADVVLVEWCVASGCRILLEKVNSHSHSQQTSLLLQKRKVRYRVHKNQTSRRVLPAWGRGGGGGLATPHSEKPACNVTLHITSLQIPYRMRVYTVQSRLIFLTVTTINISRNEI
jgi:hypothetical protein